MYMWTSKDGLSFENNKKLVIWELVAWNNACTKNVLTAVVSPRAGEVSRSDRGADRQTSPPASNLYNLTMTRCHKVFAPAHHGDCAIKANAL